MKIPKNGSKWTGGTGDRFHVLNTIELDGHTWVHYIKEDAREPREYSCYVESFLERFRELPE
jgi:hypothetical protein